PRWRCRTSRRRSAGGWSRSTSSTPGASCVPCRPPPSRPPSPRSRPIAITAASLRCVGLVRLGYENEATAMPRALREAVLREGVREYYGPRDGRGLGAREFAWSTLLVEMTDADPSARTSYL